MPTQHEKTADLLHLYKSKKQVIIEDYFKFLKFKSVSSEPEYKKPLLECAEWLTSFLKEAGFHVELWPTAEHPVVFASYMQAGPDKPTILIYNHYDVQPVDPLEEWTSPPFEPSDRSGVIYARGAQDNKGQCLYVIQALKALLQRDGTLPINVKLCIEGEEETGSTGLSSIMKTKKEQLKADYLAIADLGLRDSATPAITLGIRGIVSMDVEAQGSIMDLHSGMHGGLAFNPIHALVAVLSKLRDDTGKIAVPGFYDAVDELKEEEKTVLALDFDVARYEKMFGIKPTGGEKAFTLPERNWMRPTVEINGITGGYSGPGFKTVIPAKASAKVSCRVVPRQDPQQIGNLVARYLEKQAPEGVKITATVHPGGGKAVHAKPTSRVVKAFAKAFTEVFAAPCEFIFEGASIPIVTELAEASGGEVVLMGLGLPDDHIHAPNERFSLDRIEKGFLIIARALQILGDRNDA